MDPTTPVRRLSSRGRLCLWLSPARKAEVVASPDRNDADRTHALHRRPEQMLAFIGIRPGMMALDISAGGGYTTELLARGRPARARLRPGR